MYVVYILECHDGTYYTGCTANIEKRLLEHNTAKKGAHYTKIRRPVILKYSEKFATLREARSREYAIKQMKRSEKASLFT